MCSCECKYVCARVGMWVYGTIVKVCACTSVYVCIRMSMNVYECVSVCTCSSINVQCGRESTIIGRLSSGHQWKQARMFLSSGYAAAAVKHRTPAPAASRVPAALLAVFAPAPDPAVGAHAFAAAVAAEAPPRLCSQMPAPPQSLHVYLTRLCWRPCSPCRCSFLDTGQAMARSSSAALLGAGAADAGTAF